MVSLFSLDIITVSVLCIYSSAIYTVTALDTFSVLVNAMLVTIDRDLSDMRYNIIEEYVNVQHMHKLVRLNISLVTFELIFT